MCSTNNGFVIADEDLKMRGPGDFFRSQTARTSADVNCRFADTKSLELSQKIARHNGRAAFIGDGTTVKSRGRPPV